MRGGTRINKPCSWNLSVVIIVVLMVIASITNASCALGKPSVKFPVTIPDNFSRNGSEIISAEWWKALSNENLNAYIKKALEDNFSIRAAWDRLNQARASLRKAGADLYPSAEVSAGHSRTSYHSSEPGADTAYTLDHTLGLSMSYEVDLWGRIKSSRDALKFDAMARVSDIQSAALTVAAEIAKIWVQVLELNGEIAITDSQIETSRKYLELINERFKTGQATTSDVLQQEQAIEELRGSRKRLESSLELFMHQLAVYIGVAPGSLEAPATAVLPALPPLPATGIPSEALANRPDINSALMAIKSSSSRVAEAVASRFPRLSITAKGEFTADDLGDLFDGWLRNFIFNLSAPIFDAGKRKAEVERTRAVLSEKINNYSETILKAIREVEDALVQEQKQREYIESLSKQLDLARRAAEESLDRYINGTEDFTRYLTAQLSYQRLQKSKLQAERDLLLYRIDLYRAVAGPLEISEPDMKYIIENEKKTPQEVTTTGARNNE